MTTVPEQRIGQINRARKNRTGDYVLYWMTSFRRLHSNFALQHAADLARESGKPLVILEALWVDYPYASQRLHQFILDGMAERNRLLEETPVLHFPFVERVPGESEGLLEALSSRASSVVTDDFPSFVIPEVQRRVGPRLSVSLESVDSNGLLPLKATDRVFSAAYHFRRFLQKTLPEHLPEIPDPHPLKALPESGTLEIGRVIDPSILERWPVAGPETLAGGPDFLATLTLDAEVAPTGQVGTSEAGRQALNRFLTEGVGKYVEARNHPDLEVTSGLSPYLHFGLISAHEVFQALSAAEGWTPLRLSERTDGAREGWWGMSPGAEAFLDQIVTWREVGFNMSSKQEDFMEYGSLPEWARKTLADHEGDPRAHEYTLQEFREARTHDPLWNAAQTQLLREGVIHNYLRMLWGKKILEWSPSPRDALAVMIELNDRFALDGRDPNSYSGIFWCLGRYDRGWPERPIFGKVRSMTSQSTRRKVKLNKYIDRFASDSD